MDDKDPNIELFEKAINHQLLLYYWHQRSLGYSVESKIEELEKEIYSLGRDNQAPEILWQKDIDELQLLLAVVDLNSDKNNAFVTKAVVYNLGYIKVIILPDKNHFRPHFHIHYKSEYRASYAIDTLELLVGTMPGKYEKPILEWASRKQKSLKLTWDNMKSGGDVRELVLHADES